MPTHPLNKTIARRYLEDFWNGADAAVIEDLAGLASQADHLTRRTGIFFLVGAMAGQIAEESQSLGHGVLTYTFLAAVNAVKAGRLKNAPLTAEYATALSLVNYVTQRVPELLGPGHDIPIITATRNFEVLPVGKK